MKGKKHGNPFRLMAFVLLCVAFILSIAAEDWIWMCSLAAGLAHQARALYPYLKRKKP